VHPAPEWKGDFGGSCEFGPLALDAAEAEEAENNQKKKIILVSFLQ